MKIAVLTVSNPKIEWRTMTDSNPSEKDVDEMAGMLEDAFPEDFEFDRNELWHQGYVPIDVLEDVLQAWQDDITIASFGGVDCPERPTDRVMQQCADDLKDVIDEYR